MKILKVEKLKIVKKIVLVNYKSRDHKVWPLLLKHHDHKKHL